MPFSIQAEHVKSFASRKVIECLLFSERIPAQKLESWLIIKRSRHAALLLSSCQQGVAEWCNLHFNDALNKCVRESRRRTLRTMQ